MFIQEQFIHVFIMQLGPIISCVRPFWTLRRKGHEISKQEEEAALIAILLHDMGHGPFFPIRWKNA